MKVSFSGLVLGWGFFVDFLGFFGFFSYVFPKVASSRDKIENFKT